MHATIPAHLTWLNKSPPVLSEIQHVILSIELHQKGCVLRIPLAYEADPDQ
jgi:hypothetical protein